MSKFNALGISTESQDVLAAQQFRASRFGAAISGVDRDAFDRHCRHVLIEDGETGQLVGCFRFQHLDSGAEIGKTYAAQFYNLDKLFSYSKPLMEIGRFCVHPACSDPDVLRISWALLTRYVDAYRIGMMFGCSSFEGVDFMRYKSAFSLLKQRHIAPDHHAPGVKVEDVIRFVDVLSDSTVDIAQANREMPPLLRTYLTMGGWVSDHAVVDQTLETLHVFTGVEVDAIPEIRKRLLRADAS